MEGEGSVESDSGRVLGVMPTGFGKSLIYGILPLVWDEFQPNPAGG